MKGNKNFIGSWAFLIGVVLAIVFGAMGTLDKTVVTILVIIGFVIGLFNIADKEVTPFLMSGAVLIIAGQFGTTALAVTAPWIGNIFQALLAIFAPATIIVAIKNVFNLAKN